MQQSLNLILSKDVSKGETTKRTIGPRSLSLLAILSNRNGFRRWKHNLLHLLALVTPGILAINISSLGMLPTVLQQRSQDLMILKPQFSIIMPCYKPCQRPANRVNLRAPLKCQLIGLLCLASNSSRILLRQPKCCQLSSCLTKGILAPKGYPLSIQ